MILSYVRSNNLCTKQYLLFGQIRIRRVRKAREHSFSSCIGENIDQMTLACRLDKRRERLRKKASQRVEETYRGR